MKLTPQPTRRSLLAMLAGSSAMALSIAPVLAKEPMRPLSIPGVQAIPKVGVVEFSQPPEVRDSVSLKVVFREEENPEKPGEILRYRTYDGEFVGPTIRTTPGTTMGIGVDNDLPPEADAHDSHQNMNEPHGLNTTNMHTHGLWVSPELPADYVLLRIKPGESYDHSYPIPKEHVAGTFWYHPHKHGSVEAQVAQGMAGAIIIEGGIDELPGIKGTTERVMVIQQPKPEKIERFESAAQIAGAPNKVTTINTLHAPTLRQRSGAVERWRLIAANYHDFLHIQLRRLGTTDTIDLHPIAFDGIPVQQVVPVSTVDLAPGNRVDVMVPPLQPGSYEIYKVGDHGQFDAEAEDETIGFVEVGAPLDEVAAPIPTDIPVEFSHPEILKEEVDRPLRTVTYSMKDRPEGGLPMFLIDDKEFKEGRVDQLLDVDSVEEWLIKNESDFMHPFHIHVNPFQIVEISDGSIPPGRWLDTVPLPPHGFVRMRTRIQRFTGQFVQHCHILLHEDHGMMQLIEIK